MFGAAGVAAIRHHRRRRGNDWRIEMRPSSGGEGIGGTLLSENLASAAPSSRGFTCYPALLESDREAQERVVIRRALGDSQVNPGIKLHILGNRQKQSYINKFQRADVSAGADSGVILDIAREPVVNKVAGKDNAVDPLQKIARAAQVVQGVDLGHRAELPTVRQDQVDGKNTAAFDVMVGQMAGVGGEFDIRQQAKTKARRVIDIVAVDVPLHPQCRIAEAFALDGLASCAILEALPAERGGDDVGLQKIQQSDAGVEIQGAGKLTGHPRRPGRLAVICVIEQIRFKLHVAGVDGVGPFGQVRPIGLQGAQKLVRHGIEKRVAALVGFGFFVLANARRCFRRRRGLVPENAGSAGQKHDQCEDSTALVAAPHVQTHNRLPGCQSKSRHMRVVAGQIVLTTLPRRMRVLHLTSRPPDFQAEYALQAIARESGAEVELLAQRVGQKGTGRNSVSSFWWLRRRHDFDLIHAWDFPSARLAAAARPGVIFSASEGLKASELRWLKWMARHRDLQIICPAESHRQALIESGCCDGQLQTVLLPAQIAAVTARDESLRHSLGLMPEERVILAPGESVRAAGHQYALWAASILHVLDPCWRLLAWGRGQQVQALQSLAQKFQQPRVLCLAEQTLGRGISFERLLAAADLAMITPSGLAPPLPIQMCLAAGLPIVASASPVVNEFLRDRESAAVVPRLSPRLLAQRVLALSEDEEARRKFSANARISRNGPGSRFMEQYRALYAQVAGGLN